MDLKHCFDPFRDYIIQEFGRKTIKMIQNKIHYRIPLTITRGKAGLIWQKSTNNCIEIKFGSFGKKV